MISLEQLELDLLDVQIILSKIPTSIEYAKYGKYSRNIVSKEYGSWNSALMAVFGELSPDSKISKKCANPNCAKDIKVLPSELRDANYCSRSCAAIVNNTKNFKRKKSKKCAHCSALIYASHKYCPACIKKGKHIIGGKFFSERTLEDVTNSIGKQAGRYTTVRTHSRGVMKKLGRDTQCEYCGYSTSVQICHIVPISNFSLDTKISVINAPSNLVTLCRNHHWELDHGVLDIATIKREAF